MAERRKGTFPYGNNRKHGSNQRGVMAVPRGPQEGLSNLTQSRRDKANLVQAMLKRNLATIELEQQYGNQVLPVFKHKQEIINVIENYKAVILGGPTGSGKSTQVPQYLLEAGYEKIYVLVPRRVIADGLYERMKEELAPHLGQDESSKTVGVAHGERSEHSEDSRIIIMTPNTFTRMESDIRTQYGDKKVVIISDEIHEANLYTEIATGVAAKAVHEQDSWRLIAASATHNANALQTSFQELNNGFVPTINIEGRPFEVDMQESGHETPMEVYVRVGQDHEKSMIFTSGKGEIDHIIEETTRELERDEIGSSKNVLFRKLHGELTDTELARINDSIPEGYRLIIVSSPAGMSGITIPGVTLVVTDGTINRSELDDDEVPGLTRRYLSKAEITQQMGRAGRDVSGGVGVLAKPTAVAEDIMRNRGKIIDTEQMPFVTMAQRDAFGPAEIYHSNLSSVVLSVAALERSFAEINGYLPHQVEALKIITAEESLARLGALDDEDLVTTRGQMMNKFPVRPELSRGIVEALEKRRPQQQLARIAMIAAALESGGVQDFSKKSNQNWRTLLRPSTADDIIAQLDLMTAKLPEGEQAFTEYLADYDLSYKRIRRTEKVTRKILKNMGISLENIVLSPSNENEEIELRSDLTAGLIDFVYERTGGTIDRYPAYRNIHGGPSATQRFISNRSVSSSTEQYIAGFPRWFKTALRNGGQKKNDVVELTMPVKADVVGLHAKANGLLERSVIEATFEDGRVVEKYQPSFGSIAVGHSETGVLYEEIPQPSQELLVQHVLSSPGVAQRALREIASEIEYYQKRLPSGVLDKYVRTDAPEFMTKAGVEVLIREEAKKTRQAHEVDNGLSRYVFKHNISVERYFDQESRLELQRITPSEIMFGSLRLQIQYEHGLPYVNGSRASVREQLKDQDVRLPDGREVFVQVNLPGSGKVRVKTMDL